MKSGHITFIVLVNHKQKRKLHVIVKEENIRMLIPIDWQLNILQNIEHILIIEDVNLLVIEIIILISRNFIQPYKSFHNFNGDLLYCALLCSKIITGNSVCKDVKWIGQQLDYFTHLCLILTKKYKCIVTACLLLWNISWK